MLAEEDQLTTTSLSIEDFKDFDNTNFNFTTFKNINMASTTDKIKHALHMDKNSSTTSTHNNGVPEGTAGPHTSRIANAADPRIDSDLDSSNRHAGTHNGAHAGTTGAYGSTGNGVTGHSTTGAGYDATGPAPGTAGPHSSNLLNKADPTVDSDLDGGRHLGAKSDQRTAGYTGTGTTGTTHTGTHTGTGAGIGAGVGSGIGSTHTGAHTGVGHSTSGAGYGTSTSTNAGPHSSSIANKIDPRVDSTTGAYGTTGTTGTHSGHSTTGAYGTTGNTGLTGTHNHHTTTGTGAGYNSGIGHSTNAGPHNSNIANKVDPTVDSDRDGRGPLQHAIGGNGTHATPGSGKAQNTAGPHNSDLLNKLDPVSSVINVL